MRLPTRQLLSASSSKVLDKLKPPKTSIRTVDLPCEDPIKPKKHVFQEIRKLQCKTPAFTIQDAAAYVPSDRPAAYFRYPYISNIQHDADYALRSCENEYTFVHNFPESTDYLMIGGGLMGSAAAYYTKKTISRSGDVLVLDKDPYSPHNCTAICNGLISAQSKSRDISRIASLSKELIRNLRSDVLVTDEDFAQIKYRPCTHLILWPESEVDSAIEAVGLQLEDGCHTESKLPNELETMFPWLKVCDTDVALGTHGSQDEALVDPIGLRNLYRTLAQAYGAFFIKAEVVDFNTIYSIRQTDITNVSASAVVARMPATGELRSVCFASTLLCLGHNTPYLESRAEMADYKRDQIEDMHFIQPKLRMFFAFQSLKAPVINFPVITDTDGSMLIKDNFAGLFKYYLSYEESASFLDMDYQRFLDLDSEEPYQNLIHKDKIVVDYFNDVIKPKLVKRIPIMEDAKFTVAYSGFESYNSHDGNPIISPHPYHASILLSGGFGSRMMTYAPAAAATFSELMIHDEEETFDMTNFYWNRVIRNTKLNEFRNLTE